MLSPMRVAFLRHVGPYEQIGETWGRLMAWAGMRGLFSSAFRMLGIVHDDPEITPPDRLRYEPSRCQTPFSTHRMCSTVPRSLFACQDSILIYRTVDGLCAPAPCSIRQDSGLVCGT